jgi:hypothetical protein
MTFIGFHGTFLIQHSLGNEGMPRRYVDYLPGDKFTIMNTISTIFSFVLGASIIPFVYNATFPGGTEKLALRDDPWGHGKLAGMGDLLAAPAAQLRGYPEDPFGAAGVRGPLPPPDRPARHREARRPAARALRGCERGRTYRRAPAGFPGPGPHLRGPQPAGLRASAAGRRRSSPRLYGAAPRAPYWRAGDPDRP